MEANYMILNNATIREIGKYFHVGKSTVHKDLNDRLKQYDVCLYQKVQLIIKEHLEKRHLKGGEMTKFKYKKTGDL